MTLKNIELSLLQAVIIIVVVVIIVLSLGIVVLCLSTTSNEKGVTKLKCSLVEIGNKGLFTTFEIGVGNNDSFSLGSDDWAGLYKWSWSRND